MKVHVYDFRWNDESSVRFEASDGSRFGNKPLKIGDSLSISVQGAVACAGSSRDEVWKPCPNQVSGRAKCDTCRNREGGFIYTAFDGFNTDIFTPEDLQKIDGEHFVYLALFDENTQKIGVSKHTRKTMRQLEQGSTATLFIAKTPNGVAARQIETLFRQSGMLDKIQSQAKKDGWKLTTSDQQVEAILTRKLEAHRNCLQPQPHLSSFLLDPPEFKTWSPQYGLPVEGNDIHEIKLAVEESVSGKIVAIKGAYILLDTGDELTSICARDLRGYWIDFSPTPPGLNLNQALQGALF